MKEELGISCECAFCYAMTSVVTQVCLPDSFIINLFSVKINIPMNDIPVLTRSRNILVFKTSNDFIQFLVDNMTRNELRE